MAYLSHHTGTAVLYDRGWFLTEANVHISHQNLQKGSPSIRINFQLYRYPVSTRLARCLWGKGTNWFGITVLDDFVPKCVGESFPILKSGHEFPWEKYILTVVPTWARATLNWQKCTPNSLPERELFAWTNVTSIVKHYRKGVKNTLPQSTVFVNHM